MAAHRGASRRWGSWFGLVALGLSACGGGGGGGRDAGADAPPDAAPDAPRPDAATDGPATDGEAGVPDVPYVPDPYPDPVAPDALMPVGDVLGTYMGTSVTCAPCHSNASGTDALRDDEGRPVGQFDLWRASMKANAARDPFWRAMVSAEVAWHPGAKEAIEAKCTRCHAPALSVERALTDGPAVGLDDLDRDTDDGHLAIDGVTCTVCHQIQPDGLGTEASYTGRFVVGRDKEIYGPHENPFAQPMRMQTGYNPVQADHVTESSLCGSCHTLRTDTIEPDGTPTGHGILEQGPYLEWRNSVFTTEGTPGAKAQSCQGCHVPTNDEDGHEIIAQIARTPRGGDYGTPPHSPYGRHLFVGGNVLLPAIFRDFRDALRPDVPEAAFQAVVDRARQHLEQDSAEVEILSASVEGGTLLVEARVVNRTGHKLPSAYPSRRAWLALEARDASGEVVLAVGAHDEEGRLLGADGSVLPSEQAGGPTLAHRDEVTSADAPLVYQAIMAGVDGEPTFSLLSAAEYWKDNRLLPEGWRDDGPDAADTRPRGVEDDDFVGGEDRVTFRLPLPEGASVARVELKLQFQVIAPRFAEELFRVRTRQVAIFEYLYRRADRRPVTMASASVDL